MLLPQEKSTIGSLRATSEDGFSLCDISVYRNKAKVLRRHGSVVLTSVEAEEGEEPVVSPVNDNDIFSGKDVNTIPAIEIVLIILYMLTRKSSGTDGKAFLVVTANGYATNIKVKVGGGRDRTYPRFTVPSNLRYRLKKNGESYPMVSAGKSFLVHHLVYRFDNIANGTDECSETTWIARSPSILTSTCSPGEHGNKEYIRLSKIARPFPSQGL